MMTQYRRFCNRFVLKSRVESLSISRRLAHIVLTLPINIIKNTIKEAFVWSVCVKRLIYPRSRNDKLRHLPNLNTYYLFHFCRWKMQESRNVSTHSRSCAFFATLPKKITTFTLTRAIICLIIDKIAHKLNLQKKAIIWKTRTSISTIFKYKSNRIIDL